jgi:hypothetical protein
MKIRQCLRLGTTFWSGMSHFKGLPVAAAHTHCKVQSKRVHAEIQDVVHAKVSSLHAICSGRLKGEAEIRTKQRLSTANAMPPSSGKRFDAMRVAIMQYAYVLHMTLIITEQRSLDLVFSGKA